MERKVESLQQSLEARERELRDTKRELTDRNKKVRRRIRGQDMWQNVLTCQFDSFSRHWERNLFLSYWKYRAKNTTACVRIWRKQNYKRKIAKQQCILNNVDVTDKCYLYWTLLLTCDLCFTPKMQSLCLCVCSFNKIKTNRIKFLL